MRGLLIIMPGNRVDELVDRDTLSATRHWLWRGGLLWGAFIMMNGIELRADTIDNSSQEPYEQCGYCHEYDGNTVMADFPRLAGQWPAYLRKQLHDFRAKRRISSHMNPTAELLSDEDIESVVTYFNSQLPRTKQLPAQNENDAQHARRLFTHGDTQRSLPACIECHGDQGQGRAQPLAPNIAGQQPDYLQRQLNSFRAGDRRNDPDARMRNVAALLTDHEIVILKDFLARMQPVKAPAQSAVGATKSNLNLTRNTTAQTKH